MRYRAASGSARPARVSQELAPSPAGYIFVSYGLVRHRPPARRPDRPARHISPVVVSDPWNCDDHKYLAGYAMLTEVVLRGRAVGWWGRVLAQVSSEGGRAVVVR